MMDSHTRIANTLAILFQHIIGMRQITAAEMMQEKRGVQDLVHASMQCGMQITAETARAIAVRLATRVIATHANALEEGA